MARLGWRGVNARSGHGFRQRTLAEERRSRPELDLPRGGKSNVPGNHALTGPAKSGKLGQVLFVAAMLRSFVVRRFASQSAETPQNDDDVE